MRRGSGRSLPGEGCTAFTTELEQWWVLKAAMGTMALEGNSTLAAELHPLWIFKPTAQALHAENLRG
jgi:hypothetical protein